jgi:hypothetical protein
VGLAKSSAEGLARDVKNFRGRRFLLVHFLLDEQKKMNIRVRWNQQLDIH